MLVGSGCLETWTLKNGVSLLSNHASLQLLQFTVNPAHYSGRLLPEPGNYRFPSPAAQSPYEKPVAKDARRNGQDPKNSVSFISWSALVRWAGDVLLPRNLVAKDIFSSTVTRWAGRRKHYYWVRDSRRAYPTPATFTTEDLALIAPSADKQ